MILNGRNDSDGRQSNNHARHRKRACDAVLQHVLRTAQRRRMRPSRRCRRREWNPVAVERAGLRKEEIHDLFVTHAHTDHLLGVIWLVRMALQFRYSLNIWSHAKVLSLLDGICRQILPQKEVSRLGDLVAFQRLEDGGTFRVGDMNFQCFDIHSSKEPQFGFTAIFANGRHLCCLGDEPFNPLCREYAQDADWLMHEAFCTYADRERFRPYEKSHSTARDAGRNAHELRARNLILYHTEDRTLETRSERYANEAHEAFTGNIIVPDDLQIIPLD